MNLELKLKEKGFSFIKPIPSSNGRIKVKCDKCDTVYVKHKYSLLKKKEKYCVNCKDTSKYLNEIGRKYKKLEVVEFLRVSEHSKPVYKFKCDCGNFTEAVLNNVIFGKTGSCGCFKTEYISRTKRKPIEDLVLTVVMDSMTSKKRNKIVTLTKEDLKYLVFSPCHYCGNTGSNTFKNKDGRSIKYNGVDRVDNNRGYEKDNVVPCCKFCNIAKSVMSYDEFKQWLSEAYLWEYRDKNISNSRLKVNWTIEDMFG